MTRFEKLPADVREKLKTDPRHTSGNELLPAEVAVTILEHGRPIWTASQMQSELSTDHGKETVRDKLNKLEEMEICGSMPANNGRIYWWNDERSVWPIPPDVVVEGQQELTVTELLDPWYAKVAFIGFVGPALAGLPLLVGTFAIGGTISVPVPATELLSLGLVTILLSYFLLVYAGILGVVHWAAGDSLDLRFFRSG